MGFKDFRLKLKAFRLRQIFAGHVENRKGKSENSGRKAPWMMHISHGYHVVEVDHQTLRGGWNESESDSVVIQREQIEDTELWFFGVFDARIADGVSKYMQSHLFHNSPAESQIRRKSKETMRKAHIDAKARIREMEKPEEACKVGSASAIVIDGDKLVVANMGDYRAVVCRDGEARHIGTRHQTHWSRKFIPGAIRIPRVRILACESGKPSDNKASKGSELVVGKQSIASDTEFVILASTGVWEVMKHQEAVNLVRHIEDPQEAAECLAKEALTRMSKSNIACLVFRFD